MCAAKLLRLAAAAALLTVPQAGWTVFDPVNDDTDIFLANPSFNSTRPNVLIFLDNTANWSQSTGGVAPMDTKYGSVRISLGNVITNIVTDNFNVGLALFVETGSPNNATDGAYMRYGVRQMTAANKNVLTNIISSLDSNGDKGNAAVYSLAMAEMFKYFAGTASFSGHGKNKADAGDTVFFPAGRLAHAASPLASPALPAGGGTSQTYVSPITDGCQKNFIVIISNGEAADNSASLGVAQDFLSSIVGASPPATIAISPNGEQGLWMDEYAKYMANGDCNQNFAGVQNVFTYTIDVMPKSTGQGPSHTAMLKSTALNGKGKYFAITDATGTAQLENAFKSIFSEVQAVNSVFASTTLPVSVNVRGTNLNQVYIGVFRPDENKAPRWLGNLKLYKLGVDSATQNLFLADANGAPAENASTGFISSNATSFWSSASCFWQFRGIDPNSSTTPPATGCAYPYWSDSPDGNVVEKGGAAQKVRTSFPTSNAARNLYTCVDGSGGLCATGALLSATPFNTTNVAPADVGAFTTYSVSSLNWDSATSKATLVLSAAPAPVWATGNTVRVSGVTPTVFNGDFTVTKIDDFTYTYSLSPGPDGTRGRVHAVGHLLSAGDAVYLYAGCPSVFTSWTPDCVSPTSYARPITRINADNFDYDLNGVGSAPLSQAQFFAWGLRRISTVRGLIGAPTELITIPGHGFGAPGTILNCIYVADDLLDFEWYYASCKDATVVDVDTLSIAVDSATGIDPALGATSNTAQVAVPGHVFATGQTVSVTGSPVAAYNGLQTITRLDANTVSFPSTELLPAGGAGILMGAVITSITRPVTTGSGSGCGSASPVNGRDYALVTTASAHNYTAGQTITIFNTGAFTLPAGPFLGYNGTWVVQSTPSSTTFFIFHACVDQVATPNNPAAGFTGFNVTSIAPTASTTTSNAASGSKPIYMWRYLPQADSDTPLSSGAGVMIAGRPIDDDPAVRDLIVNFTRSTDNKDNENTDCTVSPFYPCTATNNVPRVSDVRATAHSDVLHSRPATINYNRYADDNDIYVYYGSNDGVLHSVKGGITQHAAGPDSGLVPGIERWGFLPKEFFPKLKRLRDQFPTISNINQKDYFFDGSIGVYLKDAKGNGSSVSPLNCVPGSCSGADTVQGVLGDNIHPTAGDKVQLYLSLRRGGTFMYSLDVLDPAAPKLLWRKGQGDTGWGQVVGQTWSEPKLTRTQAPLGNASNPDNVVVIFGAGYDEFVEDFNPCLLAESHPDKVVPFAIGSGIVTYTASGSCTITGGPGGNAADVTRKFGRGLMVIDAFNGNVLWQASAAPDAGATVALTVPGMTCAIPSDVTVLDKDRNGFADRLYVGDTCGNVWRADISDPDPRRWTVTQIAKLSGTDPRVITDKLKFLFPPDLVFAVDASGTYTAVLLGSGDREHPFDATVQNAFFMIKDRDSSNPLVGAPNNTTVSFAQPSPDTSLAAPLANADLFDATNAVVDETAPVAANGWFVGLRPGEKVVGSAVTIAGTTFFNTNQPSATAGGGACSSNLGIAREYLIGFADAGATVDLNGLGTLSIANRSTIHAGGGYLPSPVPVVVEIDGKKYQAVISGTSVQTPPGLTLEKRTRTFWYKQID